MNKFTAIVVLWLVAGFAQAQAPHLKHTTSFVVFPADCNANPPMLFGGKLLTEMDRTAGITVRRFLYASPTGAKDAVTVAADKIVFNNPAQVKDLLVVTGVVDKAGTKSITVQVAVDRDVGTDYMERVASGIFTFVAYDLETKKAIPHGLTLPGKEKTK